MSSTSAGTGPARAVLVQAIPAAPAVVPPSRRKLSLEDISQYFHLPIAEAASNLGVCTSVLKRICRENKIVRWPYRKCTSGKTVDDAKKEAAREKTKEIAEVLNASKQNHDTPRSINSITAGLSNFGNQTQNRTKGSLIPITGNSQMQGNNSFQTANAVQSQTRHVPSYFDDFKYGFPSNGLSCVSHKWWGEDDTGSSNPEKPTVSVVENKGHEKGNDTIAAPTVSLVSMRKRALECGRMSLHGGMLLNAESYKLGKKKRLLMFQVFGSSLPNQLKNA